MQHIQLDMAIRIRTCVMLRLVGIWIQYLSAALCLVSFEVQPAGDLHRIFPAFRQSGGIRGITLDKIAQDSS